MMQSLRFGNIRQTIFFSVYPTSRVLAVSKANTSASNNSISAFSLYRHFYKRLGIRTINFIMYVSQFQRRCFPVCDSDLFKSKKCFAMYKSKIGAKFRDNCFFQIYILLIEEKINVAQFKDNIKKYITIFVKILVSIFT